MLGSPCSVAITGLGLAGTNQIIAIDAAGPPCGDAAAVVAYETWGFGPDVSAALANLDGIIALEILAILHTGIARKLLALMDGSRLQTDSSVVELRHLGSQ